MRNSNSWAAHVNHHSSQLYNIHRTQQSWTSVFSHWSSCCSSLAGWRPDQILLIGLVNLIYQYGSIPKRRADGYLRVVSQTPHHSTSRLQPTLSRQELRWIVDCLGSTLRNFQVEDEPAKYGLTKNITSFNPIIIAYHEHAAIIRDVWNSNDWRDTSFGLCFTSNLADRPIKYRPTQIDAGERDPA